MERHKNQPQYKVEAVSVKWKAGTVFFNSGWEQLHRTQ